MKTRNQRVLETLDAWGREAIINRGPDFEKHFTQGCECIGLYFNCSAMKVEFLLKSGATIVNSFPIKRFLDWLDGGAMYRCNLCGKMVKRNSTKRWINSSCTKHKDVTARLYRVD